MKRYIVVFVTLVTNGCFSQLGGPINADIGLINGPYIREHIPTKRMIPYEYVREADVIWSKRVWRSIDLREKINHSMYYPLDDITAYGWQRNNERWSLWTIIRTHVLNGDLRLFSPYNPAGYGFGTWDGDQLKYPIDPAPGKNYTNDQNFRDDILYYFGRLGPISETPLTDQYGDAIIVTDSNGVSSYKYEDPDTLWYSSKDIIEYHLKEDWFLDKERSVMDVRIIAIAPVVHDVDANGNIQGKRELFWLYFPHCRYVFNNYFVYNEQNDAQWMSFDDLFWKRRFSSYIYKESNVYDRGIEHYKHGVDALQESENITNEIRNIEHDLWSF